MNLAETVNCFSKLRHGDSLHVDLHRCRGFGMCPPVLASDDNPFVRTFHWLLDDCSGPNPLDSYYRNCAPANAAAVLGLPASHKLSWFHPMAAVLPWYNTGPTELFINIKKATVGYYIQNGGMDWVIADGHTQFGPVSKRKLEFEVERCRSLLYSLREGLKPGHPNILGSVLIDERTGDWVCDIKDGLHRLACLHVLGRGSTSIEMVDSVDRRVVFRRDVADWPNVKSGLFATDHALTIFDRYIEGKAP